MSNEYAIKGSRTEQKTNKGTLVDNDLFVIADSADLDAQGRYKLKNHSSGDLNTGIQNYIDTNVASGWKFETYGSALNMTGSFQNIFSYTIPTGGGIFDFNGVGTFDNSQTTTSGVRWCEIGVYIDAALQYTADSALPVVVSGAINYTTVPFCFLSSFSGGEVVYIKARAQTGGIVRLFQDTHWTIKKLINASAL